MTLENAEYREPAYRAARGPLHIILTNGLPDLCHQDTGLCNLGLLSEVLGHSRQAIYKWCRANHPNELPGIHVPRLVKLSQEQKNKPKHYVQITADALMPFISQPRKKNSE